MVGGREEEDWGEGGRRKGREEGPETREERARGNGELIVASAHGIEDETKIRLNGRFMELPRPGIRRGVVSPW
jgi:hypothetical protein